MVEGEFLRAEPAGAGNTEWCDAEVLRLLRRRCLARLRKEAEPVPPEVLARFLPAWHGISGPGGGRPAAARADAGAVLEVIEQLGGAPVPASALETLVLPGRVPGYSPALLDELTSAGEIVWSGAGALPGGDGWLVLAPADGASLLLPEPAEVSMTPLHAAVLEVLGGGGALFFRMLSDRAAAACWTARRPPTRRSPPRSGTWSGPACSPTTRSARCGCCSAAASSGGPAAPARPVPRPRPGRSRVAAGTASAGRPCRPGPGRRRSAAGGRCCPPARTSTPPCARTRSR